MDRNRANAHFVQAPEAGLKKSLPLALSPMLYLCRPPGTCQSQCQGTWAGGGVPVHTPGPPPGGGGRSIPGPSPPQHTRFAFISSRQLSSRIFSLLSFMSFPGSGVEDQAEETAVTRDYRPARLKYPTCTNESVTLITTAERFFGKRADGRRTPV
jgi:hypothetical protein